VERFESIRDVCDTGYAAFCESDAFHLSTISIKNSEIDIAVERFRYDVIRFAAFFGMYYLFKSFLVVH
jgi:hypothetical protein